MRPAFRRILPKSRVPGMDAAGTIEAVGQGVTRFQPGDDVYGELPGGAYAECAVAPVRRLARKPTNLGFAEAAAMPVAGITALQGLRDAGAVRPGHRVLINGASGGVGTFAVQVAKALGAHVTGVCSTGNIDLVRSLGADDTVDYTREDFTRAERSYDVIFDLVGNHTVSAFRRALKPDGVYVASAGTPGGDLLGPIPFLLRVVLASMRGRPRVKSFATKSTPEDLAALARMAEAGEVTPVVDRTYPLAEVAAALTHQGTVRARGKTVVAV
jgi:NADPH:quinone reductase-like Zn-dependent oxidoreductase